ncbi:hypothetical protein J4E80_004287 [Alternaria sp. BMP 0032]|nr:hypothetical protein J4E80_004287 [Alternaria sp. BMP 0032]
MDSDTVPSPSKSTRLDQQDRNKFYKGREYQDFSLDEEFRDAPSTTSTLLPNITADTRILAVCGVADDAAKIASPKADGWFLSDFYAWKHVLKGAGSSQKWLTAVDPRDLVERYEEFIHGSEHYDRKVVLSQTEIEKPGFCDDIILASESNLHTKFTEALSEEAALAGKKDHPLVILMFAHGDFTDDFGFDLGSAPRLFNMKDFKQAVKPTQIRMTILSTACYSGGWAVYHDFSAGIDQDGNPYTDVGQGLNASIMTAGGPSSTSESYGKSHSIGRHCGSYFVTAMLKSLRAECEAADAAATTASTFPFSSASSPENVSTEQETYLAFTVKIYDTMRSLDRQASKHQIRFAAQDDGWMEGWNPRSGLPMVNFKTNWDELQTVEPAQGLNPDLNRAIPLDDGVPDNAASGMWGSLRRRTAPSEFKMRALRVQCQYYLNSLPGLESLSENTAFHAIIQDFLNGEYDENEEMAERVRTMVEYRNTLTGLATELVTTAKIARPNNFACSEFDNASFQQYLRKDGNAKLSQRFEETFLRIGNSGIFPYPNNKLEGRRFSKPIQYITAAVLMDKNIRSDQALQDAVGRIVLSHRNMIHDTIKKVVDKEPELRRAKESWFASAKKRLRSLSPSKQEKRRSVGGTSSGLGSIPGLSRRESGKERKDKGPADRMGRRR